MSAGHPPELTLDERRWIEEDQVLWARARQLAAKHGRDERDLYRTLKNFRRSPGERLRLGLKHARLHPKYRRTDADT